jgi:ketosteroid isomerase-like protein
MTTEEARRFLQRVFDRLFDPASTAEEVGAFFSPDYVQDVDGRRLDRGEFMNHVRMLKNTLEGATVTFKQIAADGQTIADIHVVEARKKNGERVRVKVIAFYTLQNGKISSIEELTYLLEGRSEDRDLGFRVLH